MSDTAATVPAPVAVPAPAPAVDMSKTIADAVKAGVDAALKSAREDRTPATKNAEDVAPRGEQPEQRPMVTMLRKWAHDSDPHEGKGLSAGRCVLSLAYAHANPGVSVAQAAKRLGYVEESKALGESTASGGGTLVPVQYVAEIIELLRSQAVVRSAGARIVPMPSGTMEMPEQTGGATAYYAAENAIGTASEQTTGSKKLTAKTLTGLVPVSDQLLADAPMSAEMFVRDDLVRVMALREDLAFLRGAGGDNTPLGIFKQAGNTAAMTASPDLDNAVSDIDAAEYRLDEDNVPMQGRVWFMHPRIKKYLRGLKTSAGDYRFREELDAGKLNGYPVFLATQIPIIMLSGADTGGTESEFGLVWMPDVLVGDTMSLEIEAFRGGSYEVGSSSYSGISRRQTIIRAVSRHDCLLRHANSASMVTGCTWGA